jgi:hypothetical protein
MMDLIWRKKVQLNQTKLSYVFTSEGKNSATYMKGIEHRPIGAAIIYNTIQSRGCHFISLRAGKIL